MEGGSARPSRDLLVCWLTALVPPLVVLNRVMGKAEFAPVYTVETLSDRRGATGE